MTTRNQNLQPYRNIYFSGMVEIFYKRYQLPLIGRKNVLYIVREDENYDNTPIGYLYLDNQYQVVMKDSNTTLQVDLNNKANVGHTHSIAEISDFLTLGVNELKSLNFAIKDDTLIGLDNVWSSQKVENELNANRFKVSQITDISTVGKTGSYNDLTDKPLVATQTVNGLMSNADKTKLDNINNIIDQRNMDTNVVKLSTNGLVDSTLLPQVIDDSIASITNTYSSNKVESLISNHTHNTTQITGLSTIATSGDYNDLINKPTIATEITDGLMSSADKLRLDNAVTSVNMLNGDVILTPEIIGASPMTHTHEGQDITTPVNEALDSQQLGGIEAGKYYSFQSIVQGEANFSGDINTPVVIESTVGDNPFVIITLNENPLNVGNYWYEITNGNEVNVYNDGTGTTKFSYILIQNKLIP